MRRRGRRVREVGEPPESAPVDRRGVGVGSVGPRERHGERVAADVEPPEAPRVPGVKDALGVAAVGVEPVEVGRPLVGYRRVERTAHPRRPVERRHGPVEARRDGPLLARVEVGDAHLRRHVDILGVARHERQAIAARAPPRRPRGHVAVRDPTEAGAVGPNGVHVHGPRIVGAVSAVREERHAVRTPRGLEAEPLLDSAPAVRAVEASGLPGLGVHDEQVRVHGVEPARAVVLVPEALGLHRAAALAPVEVLALLVGRGARRHHQPVAARPPVELARALLELGDLPRVPAAL